ncbi:hypothetical protein MKK70_12890 [Methylobacterium sp. E-041]|uniref:hypothetical protein n=1 Tax=Methylobacterium sp. E-041 TaxID=2836573 RepID=UPI001FB8B34C|nr:hypothetical protein [Methylobacterium sp. E-041]MCJ2106259.1 hypothetical protein [Methylobacterium sp. E-041]
MLNYINNDSWLGFASSVPWQVQRWQGAGVASIWSVPLTVWGTSLEQVATGAYDNYFQAAANALAQAVPSKDGNIYVRLGWEFNGTWMPWAAQGHEAAFIKTFQDVVDVFRSASDKFKFVWDVNEGGSTIDPAKWSAPIEVVRPLVWLLSLEDGRDGKAPEARGDRREATSGGRSDFTGPERGRCNPRARCEFGDVLPVAA